LELPPWKVTSFVDFIPKKLALRGEMITRREQISKTEVGNMNESEGRGGRGGRGVEI
jgi:hypothetical protein